MTAERIEALIAQLLRAETPEVADAVAAQLQIAIAQYLAVLRVQLGDSIQEAIRHPSFTLGKKITDPGVSDFPSGR